MSSVIAGRTAKGMMTRMGFLDRIKKEIDGAAEAIGAGAAQQSEMLRLKRQMGELDEQIRDRTLAVGERALELQEAGELNDPQIAEAAAAVAEAEAKVRELAETLERVRSAPTDATGEPARCAKCGKLAGPGDRFCAGCGGEIERPAADVPPPRPVGEEPEA